ncbi:MAG TPA: cytochrome c-type biogenesis protein [Allosphingosinicella sp.]|nr:cytochrome c-type biogenesis protein [Allosphingosinicella sp.]
MRLLLAALMLAFAAPALADSLLPPAEYADRQLADPAKEAEARALMDEIRCLVCQGEAVADSPAEMAGDMRALIRTRIQAGESPDQVRQWLISRYGPWVTYDPPFGAATALLWLAPLLLVLFGLFLARGRFKRRTRA